MDHKPDLFTRITTLLTEWFGHPVTMLGAVAIVLLWLVGSVFVPHHFGNNTYQLYINTGTTCVTFIMVFIIQATANREMKAVHAKLDAILKDTESLPDEFIGIESLSEKEITQLQEKKEAEGSAST